MGNEYKILRESFTVPFDFDMLERPCTYPGCLYKLGFCYFKTKELRSRVVAGFSYDTENPWYSDVDPKDWTYRNGNFVFAKDGITKRFEELILV